MLDVWQVTATFSGIKGINKTIITNVIIARQLKKGGGGGEGTQNHLIFKIRHSFPFNNPTVLVSIFFLSIFRIHFELYLVIHDPKF